MAASSRSRAASQAPADSWMRAWRQIPAERPVDQGRPLAPLLARLQVQRGGQLIALLVRDKGQTQVQVRGGLPDSVVVGRYKLQKLPIDPGRLA